MLLFRLVRPAGRQRQRTYFFLCAVTNFLSGHLNAKTFNDASLLFA